MVFLCRIEETITKENKMIDFSADFQELIAKRNRPMITALTECITHLEKYLTDAEHAFDPDARRALYFAKTAVALESSFQEKEPE